MLRDAAPMIADPTPRKNIAVNEDIVSIFRLRIMSRKSLLLTNPDKPVVAKRKSRFIGELNIDD